METTQEMNKEFQSIAPKDPEHLNKLRWVFDDAAKKLNNLLPDGRYKALMNTNLEQAAMWASKSYTHEA